MGSNHINYYSLAITAADGIIAVLSAGLLLSAMSVTNTSADALVSMDKIGETFPIFGPIYAPIFAIGGVFIGGLLAIQSGAILLLSMISVLSGIICFINIQIRHKSIHSYKADLITKTVSNSLILVIFAACFISGISHEVIWVMIIMALIILLSILGIHRLRTIS